ncbi:hypothetical protein GQ457_02G029250 [Hibiscus cannabinus]
MVLKYNEGISIANHGIITLDLAKSGVLNEEVRRRSYGSISQSEVLVTENRGRNKEKDGNGRDKSRSKSRSRYKNLECHHCACDETSWVIDTGALIHVTSRRDFFTSYNPGNFGVLKMGNDGLVSITGMRDVSLVSNNGTRLTKGSLVVAREKKSSNLYLMQALTSRDIVNVTMNDSSTKLWHKRHSHMSERRLNCLAKKNQLSGLKNVTLKNCAHRLAGKQRRVPFSSRTPHRKSKFIVLLHSDVYGSIKVRSHGGALYFVTFIVDCSRKLWVCTLKSKDQVFETFKQFQASVERETRKKLKFIHTDNDGEYRGPFHEYCLRNCKEFVQVTKDERSKLDAKTRQCIFIGYGLDEKEDLPDSGDLTDVNPVPLDPSPNPIKDDVHGDANDDQWDIVDFDAPIDDVVNDQQQAPISPPTVPLRRSSRDR